MLRMNEYDRRHMLRLAAIAKMVERLYDAAADDAAAIAAEAVRLGADGEKPFDFADYPGAKVKMEELLAWLRSQLEVVVAEGVAGEWLLSNEKNDALVRSVLGISEEEEEGESGGTSRPRTGKLPEKVRRRWMERNEKARDAFLKREERGMGLSKYVWKVTERLPTEMRMSIDMGILDGKPAAAMARDIKQYLKFPDKLFRRVRDERGILHLSKNAAAFHPGQGVYRSSYQNARRLAVTETNMAYRTADHERWQRLDFVVGIEIHLSGNHTCKGRDGKPHRFTDICDQLQGKYPKDFKFTGWHPHCRCYATTILKTEEEMDADMDKIMAGEPVDGESVNKVTEPPRGFSDWVEKNEERIAGARERGTLPGWVKENEERVSGVKEESEKKEEVVDSHIETEGKKTITQSQIPRDLIVGSDTFFGDDDIPFDEDFFDLLDPNKPIELVVEKKDDGSYSSDEGDKVVLSDYTRCVLSPYFKRAFVYHEYGHCIDAQRGLWKDERLIDLLEKQKNILAVESDMPVKTYVFLKGHPVITGTKKMPLAEFIVNELDMVESEIIFMRKDKFEAAYRGYSKNDVSEMLGFARDTLKALTLKYGKGHSTSYYEIPRNRETEWLAQAFVNRFLGNVVMEKVMPTIYKQMIEYVAQIKPIR